MRAFSVNTSNSVFFVTLLLVLAGCKQPEPDYTTVAVYPTTQQCGVNEQMMSCDKVAAYLRDTLKIKPGRQVVVSSVGIDPLPKEDQSLEKIAETITAAGFKDVRTARFDMK
jgi:hypothetical protein